MLRVASKMGVSLLWRPATVHCTWRHYEGVLCGTPVVYTVSAVVSRDVLMTLIRALAVSELDYCNFVLA